MAGKKQHYIPRFYLQHFADCSGRFHKDPVHVFDVRSRTWSRKKPNKVAVEEDFYTYVGRDGSRDNAVDDYLTTVENEAAPVLQRANVGEDLTELDRFYLAVFVSTIMARVPTRLGVIENFWAELVKKHMAITYQQLKAHPEEFPSYIEKYKAAGIDMDTMTIENLNPDRYNVRVRPGSSAGLSVVATFDLVPAIYEIMGWVLLESDERDYFVTSDHPFFMTVPGARRPVGLASENIEATLPLGRNLCLMLHNREPRALGRTRADKRFVSEINRRTTVLASRFIAAPSREFPGSERLREEPPEREGPPE